MTIIMYVRFISPQLDWDTHVEIGFFTAFFRMDKSKMEDWIYSELRAQINWYNDYLDAPKKLGLTFKRRKARWGVCWFKPSAKEHIERAHYCAWLLGEAGQPVAMIKSSLRRGIVWQDEYQVLCLPEKNAPRLYH